MRGDFQSRRDLIPGLPEELAMECLVRVPFEFHASMKSVSQSWRSLISDRAYDRERRRVGKDESLLCLVQPLTSPSPSSPVNSSVDGEVSEKKKEEEGESHHSQLQQPRVIGAPLYGLSVYNATLDTWHRVAIPERVPLFCECVSLQDSGKVLLIGGWDPETLQPVRDVFVLDFSSSAGRRWRRGKPMSSARSFFACAAVGSRKVYVAGGHDDQKNAIKSAEVYDVEKDEWVMIPPMREGRDECHGFSMASGLGFCVLSGYGTETQGQFRSDAEVYDPVSNSWTVVENVWPFPDLSPRGRTSAAAAESAGDSRGCKLWCFIDSQRESQPRWEVEDELMKWKLVMETIRLPVTTMTSVFAGSLSGQAVAMIGGGGEESGTMMMKNGGKWRHVSTPSGFSSLPFSYASIYV